MSLALALALVSCDSAAFCDSACKKVLAACVVGCGGAATWAGFEEAHSYCESNPNQGSCPNVLK
jgi:hypothetical protein